MHVKINPEKNFYNEVFGSEDLVRHFPELETTGVEVYYDGDLYHIIKDGKLLGDCCFFSSDEFEHLMIVK